MLDFNSIKAKFSCIDIARDLLGLKLRLTNSGDWRGVSPAPGPHSTDDALSVTSDTWFDHSAVIGGSVLDLVAFVKFGDINGHYICEAARFLTGDDYDAAYWQKYTSERDKLIANIKKWHEALLTDERTLEYLHSRRINDTTIEQLMLGLGDIGLSLNGSYTHELRLTVPYRDQYSNPVYLASRRLDWAAHEGSPKYHKANTKNNVFLKNCPFGLDTMPLKDKDCETLCIGEGLIDGVSLRQEGYPILFSIGGYFGKDNEAIVIKQTRRFRKLITCFDSDNSGQGFTCYMGRLFLRERLNFYCVDSYGEGHKDVSDYYSAGGDIHELLSNAINGYVFMARRTFWEKKPVLLSEDYPFYSLSPNEQAKRLAEVKKFIYSLKPFLSEVNMGLEFGEVIEVLSEYYPKSKIAKYAEGPTAHEILCSMRDRFLDGRNLFYYGSIKHGDYRQYDIDGGYWYRMSDADLQAELSEFFKHEPDNKTIAQLTMMIRLMFTRQIMPEFNKARVHVFTNGTLELDTGTFREHKPDDLMTWAHDFAYDEKATCPEYDAFLEQVTLGEQSRIDFLDDLAAYALYEDCRLEKMFILIGGGENGKGTLLKTLEALFRSSNTRANSQSVTNVQPCDFDQPTQRILLEGSMLNIAHDIDANLRGCASYLKSITSGDTINGNFKFCDSHSFSPRTKIVCSSNHMIKVDDDSYGMKRRLMFCKFAACFKGRADTDLLAKLKAELPGIFNRTYRSYKALLEREKTQGNNAIRESIDQAEFIAEFTNIANPIAAFWAEYGDEYLERREVPKAEVFDAYREFCERNSLHSGSENVFHSNLQKVLQESGINHEEIRKRMRDTNGKPTRARYYIFMHTENNTQGKSKLEEFIEGVENGTIELNPNG